MAERRPDVKDFSYTDDLLDELEASLSRERLGTYLDAAGGDREGAIRKGCGVRLHDLRHCSASISYQLAYLNPPNLLFINGFHNLSVSS